MKASLNTWSSNTAPVQREEWILIIAEVHVDPSQDCEWGQVVDGIDQHVLFKTKTNNDEENK